MEKNNSSELDRLLTLEEKMRFANEVVWPAVDHLYGGDFRTKSQVNRRTRLRPIRLEIEGELGPERITIEADSPRNRTVINEDGEPEKECWVEITIEEMHTELLDGSRKVMDKEEPEKGKDRWWRDEDFDSQPWESRTFDFTNDSTEPFKTFYDLEVQDEEEDEENFLWSFTEPERLPDNVSLNKLINKREDEMEEMLSYRECLEIRAALIRFGIPADVLAPIE